MGLNQTKFDFVTPGGGPLPLGFQRGVSNLGDMRDTFEAMRDTAIKKRQQTEPERMEYAENKLLELGWKVGSGPDDKSFTVISPAGKRFNFWPFTGWFAGKTRGRGLKNLIKEGR
jgi:hypothetical protein